MTYRNSARLSRFALCVYAVAALSVAAPHISHADTPSTAALREMTQGNWTKARALVQGTHDPALAAMYEWLLYRENFTGLPFQRIDAFMRKHPHWPNRKEIQATAERNMPADYPPDALISWFQNHPPVTGAGLRRYLDALRAKGQMDHIRAVLLTSWPGAVIKQSEQAAIIQAYPDILTQDMKRRRLDYLLFNGDESNGRALAALMGNGYPLLADARIGLSRNEKNASALVSRVPSHLARDPGLLYERLRWRVREKQNDGAISLLDAQPAASQITNLEDWWKQRNILVRRKIEERDYKTAYRLAAAHDQMEGPEYADAEWISGWLALRFLNQPAKAYTHFTSMHDRVKTAISKARAAYWAGRAAAAMGQAENAQTWYKLAAQYPKVYYGQLAALQLPENMRAYTPQNVVASPADQAQMESDEMVRAIRLVHAAGLDRIRRQLINARTATLTTPSQYKAFANILSQLGLRHEVVRVAKKASGQNIDLDRDAYPKLTDKFRGVTVDKALAHAVMRQESEFDQNARSPVGALGLMQLMPRTAEEVASRKGIAHQSGWLTSRPEHNILLGSTYLNTLLNSFGGSYPLVLAAYNAGGGRVNQWLREIGDPRKGQIDWVDWIELIPVAETRNYVQRVMESYVVYHDYMGMK